MAEEAMLRKWQYVEAGCLKRGMVAAALIAHKLDALLVELEYPDYTEAWIEDYDTLDDTNLNTIIRAAQYCISCEEAEAEYLSGDAGPGVRMCHCCRFGEAGGQRMFRLMQRVYNMTEF